MTHAIIHPTPNGVAITTPTGELPIEQVAAQVAPDGNYVIVDSSVIPSDRTFRAAWVYAEGGIKTSLTRAKVIAHDIRRARRADAFAPLDEIIAKQIPGPDAGLAEAKRQAIREGDARLQSAIDAASSLDEVKSALGL